MASLLPNFRFIFLCFLARASLDWRGRFVASYSVVERNSSDRANFRALDSGHRVPVLNAGGVAPKQAGALLDIPLRELLLRERRRRSPISWRDLFQDEPQTGKAGAASATVFLWALLTLVALQSIGGRCVRSRYWGAKPPARAMKVDP